MNDEPFAYGIQAPIGSVTPLFHLRKDAEDYIAKLTDSRDEARIIPLYRARPAVEPMLECLHRVTVHNDELQYEIARLRLTDAERALVEMLADHPVTHQIMPNEVATLRGLLERLGGKK